MELRDYYNILKRSKTFIALGTLVIVALSIVFTILSKDSYDTTMAITVDKTDAVDQKQANYYLYDNYYSIQASGLFADTTAGLLQSPSIVQAIYDRAHISLPQVRNITQLTKIFTVRKTPPATLAVTIRSTNPDQSKSLLLAASSELQDRAQGLNQSTSREFNVIATAPVSVKVAPFWALNIALAVLIGLFITKIIVLIQWYLTPSSKRS